MKKDLQKKLATAERRYMEADEARRKAVASANAQLDEMETAASASAAKAEEALDDAHAATVAAEDKLRKLATSSAQKQHADAHANEEVLKEVEKRHEEEVSELKGKLDEAQAKLKEMEELQDQVRRPTERVA